MVNLKFVKKIVIKIVNPNFNKRPRGLDALLGHLIVKRIPVMNKLSSTKLPE